MEGSLRRRFTGQNWVDGAAPREFTSCLDDYMAGKLEALGRVRVRAGGTDFQHRVWAAIRQVRPGRQRTYTELAGDAGLGVPFVPSAPRVAPILSGS